MSRALSPSPGESLEAAVTPARPSIQRRGMDGHATPESVPSAVTAALSSPGIPLAAESRRLFEPRFGHDFSRVRIDVNDEAARSLDAQAFTRGDHIVFASDRYQPGTASGRHLIAHELAHVVQQSRGGGPAAAEPRHEEDAEQAAAAAMQPGMPATVATSMGPGIARQSNDPRHQRGYAGEQGMGFGLYSSQEGWILIEGPSGSKGHGVTTSGFDGIAYNAKLDELHILDNKSLKSAGNVASATAIDPARNLGRNLDAAIQRVQAMRDMPNRIRILDLLRKAKDALDNGKSMPNKVRLVVTGVGGQSSGVTPGLQSRGVQFRSSSTTAQPQPQSATAAAPAQQPTAPVSNPEASGGEHPPAAAAHEHAATPPAAQVNEHTANQPATPGAAANEHAAAPTAAAANEHATNQPAAPPSEHSVAAPAPANEHAGAATAAAGNEHAGTPSLAAPGGEAGHTGTAAVAEAGVPEGASRGSGISTGIGLFQLLLVVGQMLPDPVQEETFNACWKTAISSPATQERLKKLQPEIDKASGDIYLNIRFRANFHGHQSPKPTAFGDTFQLQSIDILDIVFTAKDLHQMGDLTPRKDDADKHTIMGGGYWWESHRDGVTSIKVPSGEQVAREKERRQREDEQRRLLDQLQRLKKQVPASETPAAGSGARPRPSPPSTLLSPSPQPATVPPAQVSPFLGLQQGPLDVAAQWVANAEALGRRFIRHGARLERQIQANESPSKEAIASFLAEEKAWRTTVTYQRYWSVDHWPGRATQDLKQLLEDPAKPGPRLAALREHLGGS